MTEPSLVESPLFRVHHARITELDFLQEAEDSNSNSTLTVQLGVAEWSVGLGRWALKV